MSYKNHKWDVVAHDYNSPYLRNWLWAHSFFKYPKLLGISRAVLGIVSKNNQIEYVADLSTWTRTHEELKAKVIKDFRNFEKLIDQSIEWGEKLNIWTKENIFEKDLSQSPGDELILLLKTFLDMQEDEYAYGTALPILDFSNFSFVEGNLNRILEEKVSKNKFQEYYSVFTEPEKNSFAQDQEESLLNLMDTYWNNANWREDILKEDLKEMRNKYPEFFESLLKHTKKYAWVYYVYIGPAFSEKDFFSFVVDYVKKGISPKEKLDKLKEKKSQILSKKKKYIKDFKLAGLDKFILEVAGRVVWSKPRRKDYQSKSYYHVEKLLQEIAKRLFMSLEQIRSLPIELLEKALGGENVDLLISNEIKNFHACLPNDDGSVTTLIGEEAKKFSKSEIKRNEESQGFSKLKELKGSTAYVGKAEGKAKIVNMPEDMAKMKEGDILVSSATTPSIVPAMKKSAAIVTDEGGLTCHAAIVSRELGIPCIVGLKVVTKFLKDGDKVEVDANKAVIKKLD